MTCGSNWPLFISRSGLSRLPKYRCNIIYHVTMKFLPLTFFFPVFNHSIQQKKTTHRGRKTEVQYLQSRRISSLSLRCCYIRNSFSSKLPTERFGGLETGLSFKTSISIIVRTSQTCFIYIFQELFFRVTYWDLRLPALYSWTKSGTSPIVPGRTEIQIPREVPHRTMLFLLRNYQTRTAAWRKGGRDDHNRLWHNKRHQNSFALEKGKTMNSGSVNQQKSFRTTFSVPDSCPFDKNAKHLFTNRRFLVGS